MKNENRIKEIIEEAVLTKMTIDVEYKPELNKVNKLIRKLYPKIGKSFKSVVDSSYFIGDVPKEGVKSKLKSQLDSFGSFYSLLNEAGKSAKAAEYLKSEFGIEISVISEADSKINKKVEKLYQNAFGGEYSGETAKEILKESVESGVSLLESISMDSLKISDEIQPQLENECDMTASQFKVTLNAYMKEKKNNTDPNEPIETLLQNIETQKESLTEILEKVINV